MEISRLGVVIVTYNAADEILDCLESLLAATDILLEIAVVDNASTDDTVARIASWATGADPYVCPDDSPVQNTAFPKPVSIHSPDTPLSSETHHITLIKTGINSGFAGGVNRGLAHLAGRNNIDRFWILNPDSVVTPQTPGAFAKQAVQSGWALMAGRLFYYDRPDVIQNDGGTINRLTGVTSNLNLFANAANTPAPAVERMQFVSGASMVASREFYEAAGPMDESYFLYYEEVDWALRRGALQLVSCPDAIIYHKAGTAIGSPTLGRPASPFSLYFKHRARLRFIKRFYPLSTPFAWAFTLAKAAQLALKGFTPEAVAILKGGFETSPAASVRDRLDTEAANLAFSKNRPR